MNNTNKFKQLISYSILTILALLMLFPLIWLISTSFKSINENILQFPPQLIPQEPTIKNYIEVWNTQPFGQYFLNSSIVAMITVIVNVLFCALAAYPLARLDFVGKKIIFASIVATIMIPFQIIMIPLYVLAVKLGLKNTYLGMILPNLASAFGIFLLKQALQQVPKELEESARIDGCSELGIWWHIMIPAIKPALVTLALFVFIGAWGDFLWTLIIIDRPEFYTLPLGVQKLMEAFSLDWRLIAAGSIIAIAPVLILFIFMQKYIVPTDIGSGVKG
jgi:putative chitobiose transport system permease protein